MEPAGHDSADDSEYDTLLRKSTMTPVVQSIPVPTSPPSPIEVRRLLINVGMMDDELMIQFPFSVWTYVHPIALQYCTLEQVISGEYHERGPACILSLQGSCAVANHFCSCIETRTKPHPLIVECLQRLMRTGTIEKGVEFDC